MLLHPLFADPYEESNPASRAAGSPRWVRICRSKIGERLAQRDILQAKSVQILAKGEIPVIRFSLKLAHQYEKHRCSRIGAFRIGDPYEESHPAMQAARLALRVRICREAVGKRLAKRDIFQQQACEFSPKARFPYLTLAFSRHDTGDSPAVTKSKQ